MLKTGVSIYSIREPRGLSARGQSALEYTTLIVCLIAALLAMGTYIKRGVQGRLKESGDELGQQYDPNNTRAFYRTVTSASSRAVSASRREQDVSIDLDEDGSLEEAVFGTKSKITTNSTSNQVGNEEIVK